MAEKGIEAETVDLGKGLDEEELDLLIGAGDYLKFLNPKNELFRERKMKENPPSRGEAIRLLAANPNLIRRPLAVKGRRILFGFDPGEWAGLK